MFKGRFSSASHLTQLAFVALLSSMLTGWAATFPLPIPTRPTSFPLKRPAITGTVVAWGENDEGQTTVPTGLSKVVAIAAGRFHTVALKNDGTVVAWGRSSQTNVPAGLSGVVAIAAGRYHTIALKNDGTVVTWGSNEGQGFTWASQTNVPMGLNEVVAIAAGRYHSLALKSNGTVVAWGGDLKGQTIVPTGLSDVVAIAGGYWHSVALKSDGTLVAWGSDKAQTAVPTGLSEVVAIASAEGHTVALKSDGTVVAWGDNTYGQTNAQIDLRDVSQSRQAGTPWRCDRTAQWWPGETTPSAKRTRKSA